MQRNAGIWKNVIRKLELVEEDGEAVGLRWRRSDPSLRSQLFERSSMREADRVQAYMDACKKAPNASSDTKRKWRRSLGL